MDNATIARVCHEVVRAYCIAAGGEHRECETVTWERAPRHHREDVLDLVKVIRRNPEYVLPIRGRLVKDTIMKTIVNELAGEVTVAGTV